MDIIDIANMFLIPHHKGLSLLSFCLNIGLSFYHENIFSLLWNSASFKKGSHSAGCWSQVLETRAAEAERVEDGHTAEKAGCSQWTPMNRRMGAGHPAGGGGV